MRAIGSACRKLRSGHLTETARAAWAAIVLGGLIAGTVDIGSACLISGRSVEFILQTIAGGLLAEQARSGGMRTALLGAVLQEAMSVLIAAIYVLATFWFPSMLRRWSMFGLAYGIVIFLVMNYLVVPLSAWRRFPHFSVASLVANLAAMLLFGLILSYVARRCSALPSAAVRKGNP